jgi:hypothetical protein
VKFVRILTAVVLTISSLLAAPAQAIELGPNDGDLKVWTKLMDNGVQAKFYAKFPQVGQKIQFMFEDDQGVYQERAWIRVEAEDLDEFGKYQNLNNGYYFVRTIDLKEGKNRLRILVDDALAFGTVTYNVDASDFPVEGDIDSPNQSIAPAPEVAEQETPEQNLVLNIGVITEQSVELNWIVPSSTTDTLLTINGYKRSDQISFGSSQSAWTFIGLYPGEVYVICAEIRAPEPLDRVCELVKTSGEQNRPAPVMPIQNASVVSATDDSISLAWSAVEGASRYSVAWTLSGEESWTMMGSQTPSFTLPGLLAGTSYRIELRAFTEGSGLGSSFYMTATTTGEKYVAPEPVVPVTGFTAEIGEVTETAIEIVWTSDIQLDRIGLSYSRWLSTSWTATARAATGSSFWITGLDAGTTYDIRLQPVLNGQHLDEIRTQGVTAGEKYVPPVPVVDPPTNLQVTELTPTTISLSWTRPQGEVIGMNIQACWNTSCTLIGVDPNGSSGTVRGLNAGLPYTVWVVARLADGSSQTSTKLAVMMPALPVE